MLCPSISRRFGVGRVGHSVGSRHRRRANARRRARADLPAKGRRLQREKRKAAEDHYVRGTYQQIVEATVPRRRLRT